MSMIVIGIDLAKSVFAVHGQTPGQAGAAAAVDRATPAVPDWHGACTGAHHWAWLFRHPGHTIKLIIPKFVTSRRLPTFSSIWL